MSPFSNKMKAEEEVESHLLQTIDSRGMTGNVFVRKGYW